MIRFKIIEKKLKDYLVSNHFLSKLYSIYKIIKDNKKKTAYAVFGEDIILDVLFKNNKKGFYIDVGCYHPIKGSLTKKLYDRGWSGINIDLSSATINLFKTSRKRDININCAISNIESEGYYSEVSHINQANSLLDFENTKKIKVQIKSLNTIIKEHDVQKIDYLNIDAEGYDFETIEGLNLDNIRPSLITIEDGNNFMLENIFDTKINNYLYKKNYFLFTRNICTSFYVDEKLRSKFPDILDIRKKIAL